MQPGYISPGSGAAVEEYEITTTVAQLSKKLALILLQANVIFLYPLRSTSQKYLLLIWGSKEIQAKPERGLFPALIGK